MDRIRRTYKSGKSEWLYKAVCIECGSDRGYVKLHRIKLMCCKCGGKKTGTLNRGRVGPNKGKRFSNLSRALMSKTKQGCIPWNKGKKELRAEVKLKQALARMSKRPWNKGLGNVGATTTVKRKIRHLVRRYIKGAPSTLWLQSIIGVSQDQLKDYIESRFQPGMSWENWTKDGWHLDHIVPLAVFNLNNLEELKKACHYTNLQPLWATDNLTKSSKL